LHFTTSTEGPIDFYKSQIQVQIIRSKADPAYRPPYTTVSACVQATIRENGFKGPFQVGSTSKHAEHAS
jgi:solute carrier family 25 carnitine/acylcarnitine transporter 20/29